MTSKMGLISAVLAAGVANTFLVSSVCVAAILITRSESRRLQQQANRIQQEVERLARAAERELDQARDDHTSEDRRKVALDNIQKFLDVMRGMNPQI
jgi:hypothetical protein